MSAALGKPAVTMREEQGEEAEQAERAAAAAVSAKLHVAADLHVSATGAANPRNSRSARPCVFSAYCWRASCTWKILSGLAQQCAGLCYCCSNCVLQAWRLGSVIYPLNNLNMQSKSLKGCGSWRCAVL